MTRWRASTGNGILSLEDEAKFAEMYRAGAPQSEWLKTFPGTTIGVFKGRITKLSLHREPRPERVIGIKMGHPVLAEGRTKFPSRVRVSPTTGPLMPGAYSAKLGSVVAKGGWRGMPIYSLTLEERATCPRSCHHWSTCFGNGMPLAWRHRAGIGLETGLHRQLGRLQRKHPGGFVVRLHVLGDFYSVRYLERWAAWLDLYPALHVFGYSAWPVDTAIGAAVQGLAARRWHRFAVRLSSTEPGPRRAVTIWEMPKFDGLVSIGSGSKNLHAAIVCPAQLGKTRSCGSCALCWSPAARERTIAFIAHGPVAGRKKTA